jgi:hypothetical protein
MVAADSLLFADSKFYELVKNSFVMLCCCCGEAKMGFVCLHEKILFQRSPFISKQQSLIW